MESGGWVCLDKKYDNKNTTAVVTNKSCFVVSIVLPFISVSVYGKESHG
jgi:hypothetical protein